MYHRHGLEKIKQVSSEKLNRNDHQQNEKWMCAAKVTGGKKPRKKKLAKTKLQINNFEETNANREKSIFFINHIALLCFLFSQFFISLLCQLLLIIRWLCFSIKDAFLSYFSCTPIFFLVIKIQNLHSTKNINFLWKVQRIVVIIIDDTTIILSIYNKREQKKRTFKTNNFFDRSMSSVIFG